MADARGTGEKLGAVPGTRGRLACPVNLPFRISEIAIWGALFITPLAFWPPAQEMFGAPKALVLRSLSAVAIICWTFGALTRRRSGVYLSSFFVPVGVFLAVSLVSTLASVAPRISWLGEHFRLDGTLALINFILLFFVATQVLRSRSQWERATLAAIAGAVPVGLIGIFQGYGIDIPLLGEFGSGWRASSTQGNPDFLGAYVVLIWPLAAAWVLRAGSKAEAATAGAILTVLLAALVLSYTRGAWIGGVVGGLVLVALAKQRPARWTRVAAPVACAFLVATLPQLSGASLAGAGDQVSAPGIEATGGPTVGDTLASMTNPTVGTAQVRLWLWETAVALIREKPVLGTGPNSFVSVASPYLPLGYIAGTESRYPDKPHNQYLELGVSSGLLGLGAYLWVLFAFGRRVFRWLPQQASGRLRLMVVGLVASWAGFVAQDFFLFQVLDSGAVFWILMGCTVAITGKHGAVLRCRLALPRGGLPALAGLAASAVVLAVWIAWRSFTADLYLGEAETLVGGSHVGGDAALYYEKALQIDRDDGFVLMRYAFFRLFDAQVTGNAARRQESALTANVLLSHAIEVNPRLALLYQRRAEALELLGRRDNEVLADYRKAVELYPYSVSANRSLAAKLHQLGKPEEAIRAELRILEVQPNEADVLYDLGLDYASLRLWDQALQAWRNGVSVAPNDDGLTYRLGTAFEARGQVPAAREAYAKAISINPQNASALEALSRLESAP